MNEDIFIYKYDYKSLNLKPDSIARAMGYLDVKPSEQLVDEINDAIVKADNLILTEGGYKIFDDLNFDKKLHKLILADVPFDIKNIIYHQVSKSDFVAVFACTAGERISEYSKKLMKEGEMLKAYVFDTIGSLSVENAMDLIQEELRSNEKVSGFNITNRYSPGYCEWNVSDQKKLFSLLPKKFCGIEITESSLMQPVKSVSGIIGIGKLVKYNSYTCNLCNMENCLYKNLKK